MGWFSRSKSSAPAAPAPTSAAPPPSDGQAHALNAPGRPSTSPTDEARILAIGTEMLALSNQRRAGLLSAKVWQDKLMDWAMKDTGFKVNFFRFVDVFPTLTSSEQVHEVLEDYLTQPGVTPPPGMGLSMKAGGVFKGTFAKTMTSQIKQMAGQFIAGTDAADAMPTLHKLWKQGMCYSVDLLGEVCVSDEEAMEYQRRYLDLVDNLPTTTADWAPNETLTTDHRGEIPRVNVSIKISSLSARINVADPEGSIEHLFQGLKPVLERAAANNVLINFDMEHHAYKDLTLALFERCCEAIDFPAGLAMQAYLRSGEDDAQRIIDWSKRVGRSVTVRLIKGAYWDAETIEAEQHGWPVPVWSRKSDSDACFERMAKRFVDAMPRAAGEPGVCLALGSHNLRSIAAVQAMLEQAGLPKNAIEYQMLEGMGDELKAALVETGHRVRVYLPVGEMIPGMAYFVRRLLENTSNESWLRSSEGSDAKPEELLASPHLEHDVDPGVTMIEHLPEREALSVAVPGVGDGRPMHTEPFRDFADAAQRDAFAAQVHAMPIPSIDNNAATVADADAAITKAVAAFPSWRDTPVRERSQMLVRCAQLMRDQRDALSGVVVRESFKTWAEADGDVCEAIDFLEYYAREAVPLFEPRRLGQYVGELNQAFHTPMGVAAVISPWNFPLAIVTGLTAAALVTGNTTIVKPAEQTPGIASIMCDLLWKAGVPRDALRFLPGVGETVGAKLVDDPRVNLIAFTGSKPVGFHILNKSGDIGPTRRVVCEMGGKNAIIVDATADLDEAVLGVRQSAFGFGGQKCSACSRVIVVGDAYDTFLHRLVEASKALLVGDPTDPGTDLGPVIDTDAALKIREYIGIASQEATVALAGHVDPQLVEQDPRHIGPHIFAGVTRDMRIANEEVFGPVLAVMPAKTFDEALEIANATDYKLTGGVFTRTPSNLEKARFGFRVGNLYLNRGNTGALVGRQPFGGFGHSGTGTKAGGRDYLHQFVYPINCTENTMRRGFAPGLV